MLLIRNRGSSLHQVNTINSCIRETLKNDIQSIEMF